MPLRPSHARFRMGPRLREDDKKKTKETSRQETVRERVECFVVSRKLATRQTRTALKLVTITEPYSPSPSFSRTREPIRPCTPSASLAKVLTAASIYKRRDNVPPSPSFSRTREPIHPRPSSASLATVLTAASIYKRRDNVPNAVILANAGTHSSASAESFVSKSPYNDKHLQTKRQRPPLPSFSRTREPIRPRTPSASLAKVLTAASIYKRRDNTPNAVILANAGTHSATSAECFVSKSPYSGKHLQTKRQCPHHRHSRERGNPFSHVRREFR